MSAVSCHSPKSCTDCGVWYSPHVRLVCPACYPLARDPSPIVIPDDHEPEVCGCDESLALRRALDAANLARTPHADQMERDLIDAHRVNSELRIAIGQRSGNYNVVTRALNDFLLGDEGHGYRAQPGEGTVDAVIRMVRDLRRSLERSEKRVAESVAIEHATHERIEDALRRAVHAENEAKVGGVSRKLYEESEKQREQAEGALQLSRTAERNARLEASALAARLRAAREAVGE